MMKTTVISAYLNLFNAVPSLEESSWNTNLFQEYGVLINSHHSFLPQIKEWVTSKKLTGKELNASFHKSWKKVQESSEGELFLEQMIHYFMSYGLESIGLTPYFWTPNEKLEIPEVKIPLFIIQPISDQEAKKRCLNLLSGVALTLETIQDIIEVLDYLKFDFQGFECLNREAQCIIADKTGILPSKSDDLFRYFVYKATESTLVINNKATWTKIQESGYQLPELSYPQKKELSKSYNRHDRLWVLGFKKANENNRKVVNEISKLSKTHHVPQQMDVLRNLTNPEADFSLFQIEKACKEASPLRLVSVLNALASYEATEARLYQIRNGKSFSKEKSNPLKDFARKKNVVMRFLLDKIPSKKIYYPKYIEYGVPTSQKQMMGNFPLGTKILFSSMENLLVGVTWSGRDIDLSAISSKGEKIGWNGSRRNEHFLYSGDVVGGEYCAEWLKTLPSYEGDYLILLNHYNGEVSNVNISIAKHSESGIERNHIINPNDLIFNFPTEIGEDSKQKTLGLLSGGEFILWESTSGNQSVSSISNHGNVARDYLIASLKARLTLSDLFERVETPQEADIDLSPSKLAKDSILSLFN